MEFGSGLTNFSSSFLNTVIEEEFRIFMSRLFHLDITAGKSISGLKTRDFVGLRPFCSMGVIVWRK